MALLVIVMGLMVSLARFVRAASAGHVTENVLRELANALVADLSQAATQPEFELPSSNASESTWADYARRSNEAVQDLLKQKSVVNDAWGNPVGYLSSQRPEIGMAPHDRAFCFSAGPDGLYLTQADNLYSYEQLAVVPTSQPAGGHGE